eukprot:6185603-Pleurochrysis_carterae.AAC.2
MCACVRLHAHSVVRASVRGRAPFCESSSACSRVPPVCAAVSAAASTASYTSKTRAWTSRWCARTPNTQRGDARAARYEQMRTRKARGARALSITPTSADVASARAQGGLQAGVDGPACWRLFEEEVEEGAGCPLFHSLGPV